MTFGGYKFSGYRVEYNASESALDRALRIHRTRVKAFISASELANSPWVFDPDRLDGTLPFESVSGAVYVLKDGSDNACGYASFFKHPGNNLGYYLILTSDSCCLDSTSGINFTSNQICTYDSSYYAPTKASCFHSISPVAFGDLPLNGSQSADFLPTQATRLISIGGNNRVSSKPSSLGGPGSVLSNTATQIFGYAIRDTDIISFTKTGTKFSASDYSDYIQVLSINAFSELYNVNDLNKTLLYPILGYGGSSEITASSSAHCCDIFGQVFGRLGNLKTMSDFSSNRLWIFPDVRADYEATGSAVIPLSGAVLAIDGDDVFENGQYTKGCVNPELLATNITYTQPSNTRFDLYAGGLMYVTSYSSSYKCPALVSGNSSTYTANRVGVGYYNIFIGWDEDNPDLRTDGAWPTYVYQYAQGD